MPKKVHSQQETMIFTTVFALWITKNSKIGHTFSLNFSTRCLRMISVAPFHIWYRQFRPFKTMRDSEKVQYPLTYKSRHWNWLLFVTKKRRQLSPSSRSPFDFRRALAGPLSLSLSQLCFLLFYSGVCLISLILNTFFCKFMNNESKEKRDIDLSFHLTFIYKEPVEKVIHSLFSKSRFH